MDVIFDIFRWIGVSLKKEAIVSAPHERRSTLKLTDILVYGWVGRKHAFVNLIGVSSLVDLLWEEHNLKVVSSKVVKLYCGKNNSQSCLK